MYDVHSHLLEITHKPFLHVEHNCLDLPQQCSGVSDVVTLLEAYLALCWKSWLRHRYHNCGAA